MVIPGHRRKWGIALHHQVSWVEKGGNIVALLEYSDIKNNLNINELGDLPGWGNR